MLTALTSSQNVRSAALVTPCRFTFHRNGTVPSLFLVDWIKDILVEAAGVEPASEKARREENYVRIRLLKFGSGFRAGENGRHLVRLISVYSSGPKPTTYPAR